MCEDKLMAELVAAANKYVRTQCVKDADFVLTAADFKPGDGEEYRKLCEKADEARAVVNSTLPDYEHPECYEAYMAAEDNARLAEAMRDNLLLLRLIERQLPR